MDPKSGFSAVGYEEEPSHWRERVRKGKSQQKRRTLQYMIQNLCEVRLGSKWGRTDRALQGPGAQSGYRVFCAVE